MNMYVEPRKRLVKWLERQLIGPASGTEDLLIGMSPLDRYPVGVLHPLESEERGVDPASEAGLGEDGSGEHFLDEDEDAYEAPGDGESGESKRKAEPIRRRRYVPPSSVGFSFCVRGNVRLRIEASAAIYRLKPETRDEGGRFKARRYSRKELPPEYVHLRDGNVWRTGADAPKITFSATARVPVWDDQGSSGDQGDRSRAGIDLRARPHDRGTVLTVTLFNRQRLRRNDRGRQGQIAWVERSLFEARLACFVEGGELVDYPRVDPSLLTPEERELELQYRERRIFAVGHGAAVDWGVSPRSAFDDDTSKDRSSNRNLAMGSRSPASESRFTAPTETERPGCVWSEFLPRVETPIVSVEARGDPTVLEIERLTSQELPLGRLRAFVGEYGAWVRKRCDEAARLGGDLDARQEQSLRASGAEARRLAGMEQEAALRICGRMVQVHERMLRGVEMLAGDPDAALAFRLANRAMLRQMRRSDRERDKPCAWRPFQLGFLLATMESTVSERDEYRDLLDLIWFQTGGGKTEAYLGLIAFLLVWRRLRYGDQGGGTAAFMRYTLRLLTRQQFERAAGLICALELLRREDAGTEQRLGTEPFSVGIWVGSKVCPNTIRQAQEKVDAIRDGDGDGQARNSLVLSRCPWCSPWCSRPFDAERGYEVADREFRFHCRNPKCEFGRSGEPLPCDVVDESLYAHPPSLLIATVDKFAHLAWDERAGAFFGAGRNRRPPDLILQDELHLISGPLGSVAGLYEAGIETAIRCRGVKPKYVASTATIRMAKEQVNALYGRGVAVFPPPGLSCDDSWFAQVDRHRPGRLYVGYLAPLKDQQHCLAPLAASLVAAPLVVFRDDVDQAALFEAWWTNVVYHGSLRGVGSSSNAFRSDVRDFGERLVAENVEARNRGDGDAGPDSPSRTTRRTNRPWRDPVEIEKELERRFREAQVEQLWSRHTAEQIADTFERLGERRGAERCLDAVLSTNMVSVGLDVSRLALMVVNGQPLTTGEYVQATSRVGRADVPGIVVANYYRHQARSLSHYESFRPYHESFYRFVEPSSVTPFTAQVRKRALHAALVIAIRHACDGLAADKEAGSLNPCCPEVRKTVAALEWRVRRACPEKADEVAKCIGELVQEWRSEIRRCREAFTALHYVAHDDKAYARLLYSHGDEVVLPGLWETLRSMRNVESPAVLKMRMR